MSAAAITRKQAEKVVADIVARWPYDAEHTRPNLRDHTHEELTPGSWSVDWEDGPEDWGIVYADEARNRPAARGVFVEPIFSFSVGLFRPF